MSKLSESVEREREIFLTCFRGEKAGLVYSPSGGGEGRFVSEDEAVGFICEFTDMAERHARRFRYSVWASVPLMLFFLFFAAIFRAPSLAAIGGFALLGKLLAVIAAFSLLGWWFTAIVQRIERARFKWKIWSRLERHPPVPELSRQEKIRRGYAVTLWQWIGIGAACAAYLALGAPASAIPAEWRDIRNIALAALLALALAGLLIRGIVHLLRKTRQRS